MLQILPHRLIFPTSHPLFVQRNVENERQTPVFCTQKIATKNKFWYKNYSRVYFYARIMNKYGNGFKYLIFEVASKFWTQLSAIATFLLQLKMEPNCILLIPHCYKEKIVLLFQNSSVAIYFVMKLSTKYAGFCPLSVTCRAAFSRLFACTNLLSCFSCCRCCLVQTQLC